MKWLVTSLDLHIVPSGHLVSRLSLLFFVGGGKESLADNTVYA